MDIEAYSKHYISLVTNGNLNPRKQNSSATTLTPGMTASASENHSGNS